ncbi:MAG: hypothetical protein IJ014_06540 [Rikenellaceae bacterium]|nr:hypothetical protein [Rikenellaceae bacterium]
MRFLRFLFIVLLTSLVWAWGIGKLADAGYITINNAPTEQVAPAPKAEPQPASSSKPKAQKSKASAAPQPIEKSTTKVEQPVRPTVAPAPKTNVQTQPQQPAEVVTLSLVEGIVGEWEPVEIADESVVFSKYGTCKKGRYGMDYVYKVSGNKVSLYYDSDTPLAAESMTAVATRQGDVYYLEIYNNGDFGGKYRRK